jgi:anti-sigma B factor antagonist
MTPTHGGSEEPSTTATDAAADSATLRLRTEVTPERTIVYCSGRVISTTADMLKAHVKPLVSPGRTLVIDLTEVTFMDSMGLGIIATLWVSAKSAQCRLTVTNLSARLRDLFTVTHLLSLFEACGETNAQIP